MTVAALRRWRSGWPAVAFWLLVLTSSFLARPSGFARAALLIAIGVIVLWCLRRQAPDELAVDRRTLRWLVAAAVILHGCWFAASYGRMHASGIPETTIVAVDMAVQGQNPYAASFDPEGIDAAGPAFGGYKYLPVMPLVYAPFILALRKTGVQIANLLLDLAVAALVYAAVQGESGEAAGLVGVLLYLTLPTVMSQLYQKGATDLLPVALLLGGMVMSRRSPALAGILIGLSTSAKLVPALAALPACLPERGRGRFLAGLALALLPIPLIWLTDPRGVTDNILRFNMVRSADWTTWMLQVGPEVRLIGRTLLELIWAGLAAAAVLRARSLSARCGVVVLLLLAAILAGPMIHQNYFLWLLPFMAVILASRLARFRFADQAPASSSDGAVEERRAGPPLGEPPIGIPPIL